MKIVFWTGYRFSDWNTQSNDLGGTETAVGEIAKRLVAYGHDVTIAGDVKMSDMFGTDKLDGITWMDIEHFQIRCSNKMNPDLFDMIIGVNYIHFLEVCKNAYLDPVYKWFWMHNTEFERWYNHKEIQNTDFVLNQIQSIITPSEWAGEAIIERIINPLAQKQGSWKGVVQSISNGINLESFGINSIKDPNKFIWSSAVDRGLSHLLDHWKYIKQIMPFATLDVYYPKYADPRGDGWYNIDGVLDKLEENKDLGVTEIGSVSQEELHVAMQKASYWMYLTHYEETFCITALEMMAAGVLPICTNVAALKEVVESGIILDKAPYETLYKQAIKLLTQLDVGLKNKAIAAGKKQTKNLTWSSIAAAWYDRLRDSELNLAKI